MSNDLAADPRSGDFWPSLDPELAVALQAVPASARAPIRPEHIAARRAMLDAASQDAERRVRQQAGTALIDDVEMPGGHGRTADLRLVLARPQPAGRPVPCVYHIHGGGMIFGNRYLGLERLTGWVEEAGVAVASVDYRLAPEHQHPAALEDCLRGLDWIREQAGELGIAADQIVLVGASAGGGIAAAMALWLRDHGGPRPVAVMLIAPMLDDRCQSPSSSAFAGQAPWDPVSNRTGWDALLGAHSQASDVPAYAAPARAGNLAGLPPMFIEVGSADIFRDEDIDFAQRLGRDGVPAELHVWAGAYHGFDLTAPAARVSAACRAARLDYLLRVLAVAS